MGFGTHIRGVVLGPMLGLACLLGAVIPSAAQEASGGRLPAGSVWGAVVDAATSQPLSGATVVLDPETGGALPDVRGGGSFLHASRAVLSDSAGDYRFAGVPPGRYRLRITRAGYRPATFSVELRGSADSRVSVGLQMEPVALRALEVTAAVPTPFGAEISAEAEASGSRVRAARRRQAANLLSDVRELTHADVVEAVTLAETDVFRALQRLPGVTTADSYSADFWVRGAPWDQTRIYFDGLPLFNPLHTGGLFSGVNPDALGGALLYPGVQPASVGGGAAAAVELATRPGGGTGELRGSADLSVASARLALEQRTAGGSAAWMLAARRSYLDWLSHAWAGDDHPVAYSFSDLTGRADFQIDGERSLVVSGLWERDAQADRSPEIAYNRGHWGNAAGRASYASPLGRLRSRHTLGVSRYVSIVREPAVDSIRLSTDPSIIGRTNDRLLYATLSGELTPAGTQPGGPPWRVGYEVVRESNLYDGPPPAYLAGSDRDTLRLRSLLLHGALWGERRWQATERLTVDGALRLEAGEKVRNAAALRLVPRLSGRYRPTPGTALSVGVARAYQYEQALSPVGTFDLLHSTTSGERWLLAGAATPAVRSDVVTFGGEAWLGDTWLASANSYVRHATGITLPDPTPGIDPATAPLFVTGESRTRGAELSLRKLAGRWTASAAYTFTHAEMEAAGLRFPSPTARTHTFDAATMVRVARALRLGAAYTAASGTPFTRAYLPYEYWPINDGGCLRDPECARMHTRFSNPYAARTPRFSRLDLLMDWSHRYRTWELGAYLQLHDALGRASPVEYENTYGVCPDQPRDPGECADQERELHDKFNGDLSFLPVIGFRVRF
jgi:hypothetical protein